MLVNTYNDWDPLEEVIVGRGCSSALPQIDLSFRLFFHDNIKNSNYYSCYGDEIINVKKSWVKEMEEDVEGFVELLSSHNIIIKRPKQIKVLKKVSTPVWTSNTSFALNVRDQTLIVGDHIIETPPLMRFRYFENDLLKHLFLEYSKYGAKWTVAPRPTMIADSFDVSYVTGEQKHSDKYEIMFDAAQCTRFGKHILMNVANANHRLGAQWLDRQLGSEFNVMPMILNVDNHIDSTIIPLRPGLLLVDWKHFKGKEMLPEPLQKWDIVVAPEIDRPSPYDNADLLLASPSIDINVLSIDPNTIICHDVYQKDLQKVLKPYNIECIPCRLRHSEIFAGAFHCITLDVRRKGNLEDYF